MRTMRTRRDFNHDVIKYRWTRGIIDTDRFFDTRFKLRSAMCAQNSKFNNDRLHLSRALHSQQVIYIRHLSF